MPMAMTMACPAKFGNRPRCDRCRASSHQTTAVNVILPGKSNAGLVCRVEDLHESASVNGSRGLNQPRTNSGQRQPNGWQDVMWTLQMDGAKLVIDILIYGWIFLHPDR